MLWYSLEAPRRGASIEYPQHMFLSRNKKNVMWIPPLICSYEYGYFAFSMENLKKKNLIVRYGSQLFLYILCIYSKYSDSLTAYTCPKI